MSSMEGKVVAITGAASGIGLATAHLLAARGACLSLADVRTESLESAVNSIQEATPAAKLHHQAVNVVDSKSVNDWHDALMKHYGRLDGAANLAGILGDNGKIVDLEDETWEKVLNVNLKGVFFCIRAQLRKMVEGEIKGSIVSAASIAGLHGVAGFSHYSTSKHGVIGLTKSAAKEVGEKGIRVNCIAPGAVQTPMASNYDMRNPELVRDMKLEGRPAQPEEIAKLIAFLLSDESTYTTGSVYLADGGWMA